MPKEETKAEIVGIINNQYYNIKSEILYNEWLESDYSDGVIEEIEKQGAPVTRDNILLAFNEVFYNNATTGMKLKLCFSAHHTLCKTTVDIHKKNREKIEELDNEVIEYREQMNNLIKLVKGADTQEKIEMLKELPLFNLEN